LIKLKIYDKELILDKINTQKDQDCSENYKEIIDKLIKRKCRFKRRKQSN